MPKTLKDRIQDAVMPSVCLAKSPSSGAWSAFIYINGHLVCEAGLDEVADLLTTLHKEHG